jgi:hypothetical protein
VGPQGPPGPRGEPGPPGQWPPIEQLKPWLNLIFEAWEEYRKLRERETAELEAMQVFERAILDDAEGDPFMFSDEEEGDHRKKKDKKHKKKKKRKHGKEDVRNEDVKDDDLNDEDLLE